MDVTGIHEILQETAAYFQLKSEDLVRKRREYRDQRALAMELMHRHSGIKPEEMGRQLGQVDYTLVSRERQDGA